MLADHLTATDEAQYLPTNHMMPAVHRKQDLDGMKMQTHGERVPKTASTGRMPKISLTLSLVATETINLLQNPQE